MQTRIVIDPVTRIEGHAKISIFLDDAGKVADAQFHVVEFRGFEKFCEGHPYSEMPGITQRICGICPVSHLLASVKTGDAIMSVTVPPAADKLRRLMNLGQIIQSHALSFFHLSAPDFLLGWESPVPQRNVFGLIASNTDLARAGIRLRQFGQEIIEILGGKKLHPAWAVPGGVRSGLSAEGRARIKAWLPEALGTTQTALALFKKTLATHQHELETYGNFPSLFMGMVTPDGSWEHHGGNLRFIDSNGKILADQVPPSDYKKYIGESVQNSSYLKSPYYVPNGFPAGMYRVGPLARVNVAARMGVPKADAELKAFKQLGQQHGQHGQGAVTASFLYHYARLIEILAGIEFVERYMADDELTSGELLRATGGVNSLHAVGASEAPRGTLFHDYTVDRDGLLQKVNFIVATGQNNLAMNQTVAQIAKNYVNGKDIKEPMLNRVEHGIRCYDPCLSCSTHAAGRMPMRVQLVAPDGTVVREIVRD